MVAFSWLSMASPFFGGWLANQKPVRWTGVLFYRIVFFFPRNLFFERIHCTFNGKNQILYKSNLFRHFFCKSEDLERCSNLCCHKSLPFSGRAMVESTIWSETDDVKHLLESQSLVTFWIIFAATKIHLPTTCEAKNLTSYITVGRFILGHLWTKDFLPF